MSILESFKGIFIEVDSTEMMDKYEKIQGAATPASGEVSTTSRYVSTASTKDPGSVRPSEKMKETLLAELNSHLAGSPYLQFEKILEGMRQRISDVPTRYIAAWVSLDAAGVKKAEIVGGVQKALAFLDTETENFHSSISSHAQQLGENTQTKVSEIEKNLLSKQEQIGILAEEISSLQKEKSSLQLAATQEVTDLDLKRMEFDSTLTHIKNDLTNELRAIETYLGA